MEELLSAVKETTESSFFLTISNLISNFSLAVSTILLGVILGADGYGLYSLVITTLSFLSSIVDFGLSFSLLRFCAKASSENKGEEITSYLSTASFLILFSSISLTSISILFSSLIASDFINRPEASTLISLASTSILFSSLSNLLTYFFIGIGRSKVAAIVQSTLGISKALLQILLVILGLSVLGAILGHVLATLLSSFIAILLLLKLKIGLEKKPNLNKLRSMLGYSIPLYLSTFVTSFISQYQAYLIGNFSTNVVAGNYKMALNFSVLISMVAMPISLSLISTFSKVDKKTTKDVYVTLTKYTSLIVFPVSLILMLFSKEGIELLFGESYSQSAFFLVLMLLPYLLSPFGSISAYSMLNAIGETKTVLELNLLNAILFVPLARVSITKHGVAGMILAYFISFFISFVVTIFYMKIKHDLLFDALWTLRLFLVSFLCTSFTVSLTSLIAPSSYALRLFVGGLSFSVTFLSLMPVFGVLEERDIETLSSVSERKIVHLMLEPVLRYENAFLSLKKKIVKDCMNKLLNLKEEQSKR